MSPLEICVIVIAVVGAGWDLAYKKIPNALTFPSMAAGVVVKALIPVMAPGETAPLAEALDAVLGIGLAFVLLVLPYALGWVMAGDVKFLMAAGAFLGWWKLIWAFLWGSAFGGLLAVVVLVVTRRGRERVLRFWIQLKNLFLGRHPGVLKPESGSSTMHVPYALAISVGMLVALYGEGVFY